MGEDARRERVPSWARMRCESGCTEGARVGARRRGNGTSDNKTLTEYSPPPACDGVGHCSTAGTPTQNAAYACGVGSIGSWPTPHATPLFLPPEDPSRVLLRKICFRTDGRLDPCTVCIGESDHGDVFHVEGCEKNSIGDNRHPQQGERLKVGWCNYVELIDTIFTDVEGVD